MTLDELNRICKDTFIGLLDIRFTEFTGKTLHAEMPVTPSRHQPGGILHGGALLSLAETLASAGSFLRVDTERFEVLGSNLAAQHLASVSTGLVKGSAELVHDTGHKQIWDVTIRDEKGKVLSISRVTNRIREKNR